MSAFDSRDTLFLLGMSWLAAAHPCVSGDLFFSSFFPIVAITALTILSHLSEAAYLRQHSAFSSYSNNELIGLHLF